MIEIRADLLGAESALSLLASEGGRSIFTCRRKSDGGSWSGDEKGRLALLEKAASRGAAYLDVELDVLESRATLKPYECGLIASYHEMEGMPADEKEILRRLENTGADVVKLATFPKAHSEGARLLNLYKIVNKPAVIIGMGEVGFPTRILGGRLGAAWTYGHACEKSPAPGAPTFEELEKRYRYDELNEKTRVFGLAGNPVSRSSGPEVLNRWFRKRAVNAVYLPFLAEEVADVVHAYEPFGLEGLSVTHPLKQRAFEFVEERGGGLSESAKAAGALNTLTIRNGAWRGDSFDGAAALEAVQAGLPTEAKNPAVLILGTGGAARSLAVELRATGWEVLLSGRSPGKTKELAKLSGGKAVKWEEREQTRPEVVVNATTLGMAGNEDTSPVCGDFFREGMTVFDMVYNPEETRFIREASARGARVVGGFEMYQRQAAMQLETWTGMKVDPAEIVK